MAELKEAAKIEMPCPILKLSTEVLYPHYIVTWQYLLLTR